jgi:hypothetical protein
LATCVLTATDGQLFQDNMKATIFSKKLESQASTTYHPNTQPKHSTQKCHLQERYKLYKQTDSACPKDKCVAM